MEAHLRHRTNLRTESRLPGDSNRIERTGKRMQKRGKKRLEPHPRLQRLFAQEPPLSEEACHRLRALAADQDWFEPSVFTKRLHPLRVNPPAVDWIFVIRPGHRANGDDVATRPTDASELSIPNPDFANVLDHLT